MGVSKSNFFGGKIDVREEICGYIRDNFKRFDSEFRLVAVEPVPDKVDQIVIAFDRYAVYLSTSQMIGKREIPSNADESEFPWRVIFGALSAGFQSNKKQITGIRKGKSLVQFGFETDTKDEVLAWNGYVEESVSFPKTEEYERNSRKSVVLSYVYELLEHPEITRKDIGKLKDIGITLLDFETENGKYSLTADDSNDLFEIEDDDDWDEISEILIDCFIRAKTVKGTMELISYKFGDRSFEITTKNMFGEIDKVLIKAYSSWDYIQ